MIATTTPSTPTLQFRGEDRPMIFFVRAQLFEVRLERATSPPTHEALTPVDIDSTMLPSMVDFENSVTQVLPILEPRHGPRTSLCLFTRRLDPSPLGFL